MKLKDNSVAKKIFKPGLKKNIRHWIFVVLFKKGVFYSLFATLFILTLYVIGGIPDPGIPDGLIFLLLRLLWYSSLLLCIFSLFALGSKIRRLVFHPGLRNALVLCFYFFTGLLGAGLAIVSSFIVAASRGNI